MIPMRWMPGSCVLLCLFFDPAAAGRGAAPDSTDATPRAATSSQANREIVLPPVEEVREFLQLNSGVVVQGGELHVRGCCRCPQDPAVRPETITALPELDTKLPVVEVEYSDTRLLTLDGREASPLQLRPQDLEVTLAPEYQYVGTRSETRCLKIAIRNDSRHAVWLPEDLAFEILVLRVERDGRELLMPQTARHAHRSSRLEANNSRSWLVSLDKRSIDFSKPGRYELWLVGIEMSSFVEPLAHCTITLH
jgi:hypothetical protein